MLRPFSAHVFGGNICIPFGSPISGWGFTKSNGAEINVIPGGPALVCNRLSKAWHYDGAIFREFANNVPCLGPKGLYGQGSAANVVKNSETFQGANWSGVAAVTNSAATAPVLGAPQIKTLRDSAVAEKRYRRYTVPLSDLLTSEKTGNFLYSGMLIGKKVALSDVDGEYLSCLRIQHIEGIDVPDIHATHDIRVLFNPRTGEIHRTYYITFLSQRSTSPIVPINPATDGAYFIYYVEGGTLFGPSVQLANDYYCIPIKLRHRAAVVASEYTELYGGAPSSGLTDIHPTTSLLVEIYPAYAYSAEDMDGINNATGSLDVFALHFGDCVGINSLMRTTDSVMRRQADILTAPISPGLSEMTVYARVANDAGFFAGRNITMYSKEASQGGGGSIIPLSDQTLSTYPQKQVIAQVETAAVFPAVPDAIQAIVEDGAEWSGRASNETPPHTTVGRLFEPDAHTIAVTGKFSAATRFSVDGEPTNTADEVAFAGSEFETLRFCNDSQFADATALCGHIRAVFLYGVEASNLDLETISNSCRT
jgi:hypothetical protein